MYVTPVAADAVGVALLTRDSRSRFDEALERFPALATRLRGAEASSSLMGAVSATRSMQHVTSGRVALIGDASGSIDAITGDGLSVAFHQALALAAAIRAGDLSLYERRHREILRRPRMMGELLLTLDGRPRFRGRAMAALAKRPELFARMLGVHAGEISLREFGVASVVALGWGVLFDF
jgi:flavin-dependent dehydrogenase